jgi:hypothetical protein
MWQQQLPMQQRSYAGIEFGTQSKLCCERLEVSQSS